MLKSKKKLLFYIFLIFLYCLAYNSHIIYPIERNWVVNTDYDLPFSTIGGETEFISELSKRNPNEIIIINR